MIALRPAIWALNAALVILCIFLLVRIARALADGLGQPLPAPVATAPSDPAAAKPRSWGDLQVIVSRNLFDPSLLAADEPAPPPEEEIDATELPLGLLGTVSSPGSPLGWAAVWNAETRTRQVVKPGDELGDGLATVVRIERERVVLSEEGTLRELLLDETTGYRPPARRPARAKGPADRPKGRPRIRR